MIFADADFRFGWRMISVTESGFRSTLNIMVGSVSVTLAKSLDVLTLNGLTSGGLGGGCGAPATAGALKRMRDSSGMINGNTELSGMTPRIDASPASFTAVAALASANRPTFLAPPANAAAVS